MVGKEILEKPKNNSDVQKKRIKELESQLDSATSQLKQLRAAKFKLALGKPKNTKGSQHCRMIVPDSHGCLVDKKAAKAFFHDLEIIKPSQIVCLGDHIDCGGFLAQHHTMGYVAQTEYTFSDDEHAANVFLDTLQEIANCETIYIEGNHERRIENWITTQTLKNTKDAEWLKERFSIETVLNLTKRGFRHIEQGKTYDKLKLPGTVKLGNCYFTHGSSTSQHAASAHVKKFGGNVVYGHCFSEDTEVLSLDGWKCFSEVTTEDKVMTMSLEDGHCEWNFVEDVFEYDHYKELIQFKNPAIDALVTEEHAMVTTSRHASSMEDGSALRNLRRRPASELMELSAFTIPLAGVNTQPDYPIDPDQLRFYGWVITEGNISDQGQGGHIRIAQSDNPEKGGFKALTELLERMKVKHTCIKRYDAGSAKHGQKRNYDAYRFNISRSDKICDLFQRDCPGKTLQPWMLRLSKRQVDILFETLILADGNKNNSARNSFQYATNKVEEMDILQAICATNGWRCSVIQRERKGAKYFCVTINKRGLVHCTQGKPQRVPYDGRVYCCSVKNQTLIVRRNGKSFVCGNTHRADSYIIRQVKSGTIGAWSPGCLCELQPLWQHTNPTEWSHGYGLQMVLSNGDFLHINVPIVDGKSLLSPLVEELK